jgi:hypothetical protein
MDGGHASGPDRPEDPIAIGEQLPDAWHAPERTRSAARAELTRPVADAAAAQRADARACVDSQPEEAGLASFVREAWPSPTFGVSVTVGLIGAEDQLEIVSELDEGGVIFGDGIEGVRVDFGWGAQSTVRIASERLRLVRAASTDYGAGSLTTSPGPG